jgi:putative flavoprotein involved in K+ transport
MDCVVVGAGPAGLAASAALTEQGVEHIVLERSCAGESWRSQRWDSFRLNTPGWMNEMLGEQPADAYASRAEVVERMAALGARAQVHEGIDVCTLAATTDGFAVRSAETEFRARAVVVATGDQNVPCIPPIAQSLPARVAQLHASEYRSADALPDGTVLVVGSAQSGCQIADDLAAAGRRVVLATSAAGRLPMPYRGRATLEWVVEAGFYAQRPADLPDPAAMRAAQPIVAAGGRALSLQALARAGVTLAGRPVGVTGGRLTFDDSAPANVAAGDAFARRVRGMIDELIERRQVDAPPAEPDESDGFAGADPPLELDLLDVGAVVWCTGFTGDFSWLGPELVDERGLPRRGRHRRRRDRHVVHRPAVAHAARLVAPPRLPPGRGRGRRGGPGPCRAQLLRLGSKSNRLRF